MYQKIYDFVYWLDNNQWGVWGWPTIILILGTGILLTIRSRFLQLRKLGESFGETIVPTVKGIGKKKAKDKRLNSISQFEAFSAAISGTVGTGNIIGVSSAILAGGPGAIFWMWVSAFFGMVTNFAENVLGLYFRKRDEKGNLSGGAMYYISEGLGWKWLGCIAAALCMFAAIGMSAVQTNKISGTLVSVFSVTDNSMIVKIVIGIVIALVTGLVIIGGIKRIGKVASYLVPVMSLIFIILSLISIGMHITNMPGVFASIFKHAFNFNSVAGGIFGYGIAQVIRKGMQRGVFSNEAGLGSSVIAHSASETREPVKQGLWGIFEVFFDTFIICTLTALTLLGTIDYSSFTGAEGDSATALLAYTTNFGGFGNIVFAIILPLFAFTTIIAWSYYGEKATEFLFRKRKQGKKIAVLIFKIIYVLLIVVAAVISSDLAWNISDISNALMAIPNLIAVVGLSGLIMKIVKNYYDRKKGADIKPMLSAYDDLNEEFCQDIKVNQI